MSFRAESRNGAIETSDMDGKAAGVAASESGETSEFNLQLSPCYNGLFKSNRYLGFARPDKRSFAPLIHPIVHRLVPKLTVLRFEHPMAFVWEI